MPSVKIERLNSDLRRELSLLLREIKDPRVSELLSITKVETSGDMSSAKVFVSAISGESETEESIKGLNSAAGFLHRELFRRMKLRKTPELRFFADDSMRNGAKIDGILRDINARSNSDERH